MCLICVLQLCFTGVLGENVFPQLFLASKIFLLTKEKSYLFAFGGDYNVSCDRCNGFIGVSDIFLTHFDEKEYIFFFYQFCCCAAAATILSGAIAGRMKWQGYIIASGMISGFVYPVVSHWLWSTHGWLSVFAQPTISLWQRGAMDFAGSGVVHAVGGLTSLVALKMLGQRNEFISLEDLKESKNKKLFVRRYEYVGGKWETNELKSYNTSLATLGIFILW